MKIGIIGGGYVGLHTALRLTEINSEWIIDIIDVDNDKISRFNKGLSPIDDYFMDNFLKENPHRIDKINYIRPVNNWNDYEVIFISLSTNPSEKSESKLNTSLIFELAEKIKSENPEISVIVRSTLNIDDSEKINNLNLNYWPEFLSQGVETSININQKVNIVSISSNDKKAEKFFNKVFENKTLVRTTTKEAIMIKVMHNSLDAYLITLSNLFANISFENNMDFMKIAPAVEQLLLKRPKIKRAGIGYGGSCYPKDSYSLINITENKNNKNIIQSFEDFNNSQSLIFLNWEKEIRNANKIVLLGSSFKGGTNDITKTPTHGIRKWLLKNKIEYKIWEPMINEKWILENEIISENIIKDISESDLVIVASDWKEFNELLRDYDKVVIDLKSFIKENGKMTINIVGRK